MYGKKEYPKGKQHFPWVKFWSFRMCGFDEINLFSLIQPSQTLNPSSNITILIQRNRNQSW